jgi:protease-4
VTARKHVHTGGWIGVLAIICVAGCGRTAYRIEPIPADRSLEEETLIDEGGLSPAKIALIDVSGMIMNAERFSLLGTGENPVSLFVEKLDKAARDPSVQGVVLRINSPGGAVTAADIMYEELQCFKRRTGGKRPVVAVMMDVAASGGYYIACGADEIFAHPTTVTGSIGVLMLSANFSGTMSKIGVEANVIKSGEMKDAGSPFRRMRDEERAIFQRLIDEYHERFVKVVLTGRPKLDEARVRELADGRVYSGRQALDLGLVDQVGTLREALGCLKGRIGARRVRVVAYKRPSDYKPNIYAQGPAGPPQVNLLNIQIPQSLLGTEPQFLYLWAPGI